MLNHRCQRLFYLNLLWWRLLSAQNTVSRSIKKFEVLRSESAYNNFVTKAKYNWNDMGLDNASADFAAKKTRRVERMPGEDAEDCPQDPPQSHRVGYYEDIVVMGLFIHLGDIVHSFMFVKMK